MIEICLVLNSNYGVSLKHDDSVLKQGVLLFATEIEHLNYYDLTLTKNYPFAGYDFMIGSDGKLYFLEANAVAGGIFVIELVYKIIRKYLPSRLARLSENLGRLVEDFVKMSITFHTMLKNYLPKTAIVTIPVERLGLLNPEREYIAYVLRSYGLQSWTVPRTKFRIKNGYLIADIDGMSVTPDIIIRKTINFPKNLKQVVINPSEVGKITGSKWKTYLVVQDLLKRKPYLQDILHLPLTFYAKNAYKALERARELLEMKKQAVIKPVRGQGGKGIVIIGDSDELEKKMCRLNEKGKYIVQEKIHPLYILSSDKYQYAFDVRVYAYLGEMAGIQIRRAPIPINLAEKNLEKALVSNISSGGTFVFVAMDYEYKGFIRYYKIPKKALPFGNRVINIDENVLIFGRDLLYKLRMIARELTIALSNAVERGQ